MEGHVFEIVLGMAALLPAATVPRRSRVAATLGCLMVALTLLVAAVLQRVAPDGYHYLYGELGNLGALLFLVAAPVALVLFIIGVANGVARLDEFARSCGSSLSPWLTFAVLVLTIVLLVLELATWVLRGLPLDLFATVSVLAVASLLPAMTVRRPSARATFVVVGLLVAAGLLWAAGDAVGHGLGAIADAIVFLVLAVIATALFLIGVAAGAVRLFRRIQGWREAKSGS